MEQLRRRFPHTLVLQFPSAAGEGQLPARPVAGTSDHAIALDFVRHVRGSRATKAESALLLQAIDACCHDPEQDVAVRGGAAPGRPGGGAA